MKVIINKGNDKETYYINWAHVNNTFVPEKEVTKVVVKNNKKQKSYTTCTMGKEGSDEAVSSNAYVHTGELYNKRLGRKISLKRVLDTYNFPKAIRKQFWNAYLEKCKV